MAVGIRENRGTISIALVDDDSCRQGVVFVWGRKRKTSIKPGNGWWRIWRRARGTNLVLGSPSIEVRLV